MSTSASASRSSSEAWARQPCAARERRRALGIEVRRGDQPDLGVGQGVPRVAAGDVAGADDADAEWGHGRRGYGIEWARERPADDRSGRRRPHAALAVPYRDPMRRRPDRAPALHGPPPGRGRPARDPAGRGRGRLSGRRAGRPARDGPDRARGMLDDVGLRAVASHEGIERLRADAGAVADRLGELGCPRVIVPWMPEADRATADDVRRFAAELGALAATAGRARDRASATTTTTSSSRRSTGRRSGTSCWPSSRPRSSSSSTSTGRRSAAATPWPRSAPSPTASGCCT